MSSSTSCQASYPFPLPVKLAFPVPDLFTNPHLAMRALLLFALGASALLVLPVQAQDAASVNWTLTEVEGLNVSATSGAATGIAVRSQSLVVRDYTGVLQDGTSGPLGTYQRWWLDNAPWPVEAAPDPTRYIEFVVAPGPEATFDVTDISFVMNAGGTGELDASVFYDTERSFASPTPLQENIDVSRTEVGEFAYTLNESLGAGDSLYLRIYPWLGGGNASATRYILLQNVTISGTSTGDTPPPPPPPYSDYVNWSLTSSDTTAVSSTVGAARGLSVRSQTLTVRDYTGTLQDGSNGPLGAYQRWWLDNAVWPVQAGPDPTRYVEFVVAPAAGYTLHVTDIDLVLNAGGTNEMDASIFYDTDRTFSSPSALLLAADVPRTTVGNFHIDLDELLAAGDSLYLRIYPWLGGGTPSATRYLLLQNVTVGGIGAEIPPPPIVGVNWPLTGADTTAASRTSANLSGNPARGQGIEIRDYTGTLEGGAEGPKGPFQRWWLDANWPDEAAPNSARYIEFVATPDEGFAFALDSLSLYLAGQGTGNMEASLYYSTDPAFSNPVTLAEGVAAAREVAGFHSFPIDQIVPAGSAVYFRIYPYLPGGSTSAGKYVLVQDVTIAGNAIVPYEVEGVLWALTESYGNAVAATGDNLTGTPAQGMNLQVRDYTGDLRDAGDAPGPLGLFQRWWIGEGINWVVEEGPSASRYVEFAASSDEGYVFRVDSISVYVHGDGTSEMMASLYYSTSPTFADSVALEENFVANDGDAPGLTRRSYALGVDVPAGESIYVRVYPWLGGGNASVTRYLMLQAMTMHGKAIDENMVAVEPDGTPSRLVLHPAYPNPARTAATLRFDLAEQADVEIYLVNVLGQRVATLSHGQRVPGTHDVNVLADGLASGVYFVHLRAGHQQAVQKIVIAR